MGPHHEPLHGRGISENPKNRFTQAYAEPDPENEKSDSSTTTQFFVDKTKTALSRNDSPDIPFRLSLNPYRGCEHGCPYCYARPTHEFLGLSAGLDFETKIYVKERAPELLREELLSPRYEPDPITLSGVTDPYQPCERRFQLTRRCLEVLSEMRHPVSLITKNHLIVRDRDLLAPLAQHGACAVLLTVTTLDPDLSRRLEPRASTPASRLQAIARLAEAGIPVAVNVAPIIPGLNDPEIPSLLSAVREAGARAAYYTLLRLPLGVAPMFAQWLENHYPEKKNKILNRVRDFRSGKLNDPRFGARMSGDGPYAEQVRMMFALWRKKFGLDTPLPSLSTSAFIEWKKQNGTKQLSLF